MAKLIIPLPEDAFEQRPILQDENGECEEFHCGDPIEVKINGAWKKFRWELHDERGWYLTNNQIAFIPLWGVEARLPKNK